MAWTPPIPEPLWKTASPEVQAAILALVEFYEQRLAKLEARVNDLENRLKLNSTNSSKRPSSDPIGMKRKPPASPSGKKRGGQPGHCKAHRALVPPEKIRATTHCKPTACRRCGHELSGDDPEPLIHQVAELPKIEPIAEEYRLHRLICPGRGETTCRALPLGVPIGSFGPYLQAVLAMLAGDYRLSKRQTQQLGRTKQIAPRFPSPAISEPTWCRQDGTCRPSTENRRRRCRQPRGLPPRSHAGFERYVPAIPTTRQPRAQEVSAPGRSFEGDAATIQAEVDLASSHSPAETCPNAGRISSMTFSRRALKSSHMGLPVPGLHLLAPHIRSFLSILDTHRAFAMAI
jgi:hypothetical protein